MCNFFQNCTESSGIKQKKAGKNPCLSLICSLVLNWKTLAISKLTDNNHNEIDKSPNTEATASEEHKNTCTHLTNEETVNTEVAQEETQKKCYKPAFW